LLNPEKGRYLKKTLQRPLFYLLTALIAYSLFLPSRLCDSEEKQNACIEESKREEYSNSGSAKPRLPPLFGQNHFPEKVSLEKEEERG